MRMDAAQDSVRTRLDGDGMSFTEFTYQLLQGYDFVHLYREHQVSGPLSEQSTVRVPRGSYLTLGRNQSRVGPGFVVEHTHQGAMCSPPELWFAVKESIRHPRVAHSKLLRSFCRPDSTPLLDFQGINRLRRRMNHTKGLLSSMGRQGTSTVDGGSAVVARR